MSEPENFFILPNDVTRCLGTTTVFPSGEVKTCAQRTTCQRFIYREHFELATPFASMLCITEQYDYKL